MAQAQLIITLEDNGTVSVSGAIENKLLCFGLLECGKEAVAMFHAEKAKPAGIIPIHRPLNGSEFPRAN
jgi:hypothetical protein